jgi:hypothetical protein
MFEMLTGEIATQARRHTPLPGVSPIRRHHRRLSSRDSAAVGGAVSRLLQRSADDRFPQF